MAKQSHEQLNALESFCVAGVAGVVSKTVSAPLERVKLMIQNQDEMMKQGILKERYKGITDCTVRVVQQEGVYHLWRGNLANCIRYVPTTGFNFMFKDKIQKFFATPKDAKKSRKLAADITAGAFAGSLSLLFVYPLDYARTRLAADAIDNKGGQRHYKGLWSVWTKTFRADGAAGLYRGFPISVAGIFVYRGLFFGLYDFLKPIILGHDANFVKLFLLGYATTVVSECVSYPFDTVRRRMMMTSETAVKYNGAMDCAKQILVKEGVRSMFKGCGANILRGMAGAVVLACYDKFKDGYVHLRDRVTGKDTVATVATVDAKDDGKDDTKS